MAAAAPPRAVVVDLDDTLVDTRGAWTETWTASLELLRAHFPGIDAGELTRRYLEAERRVFERAAGGEIDLATYRRLAILEALAPWGEPSEDLLAAYLAERERIAERLVLFADALDTLRLLRARGVRLGVLTNGPSDLQRPKLERLGVDSEVDAVAISGEIGWQKPQLEAFRHVLAELEVDAAEAAMVGDSLENDVLGAIAAGFGRVVWMRPDGAEPPAGSLAATCMADVPALLGLAR